VTAETWVGKATPLTVAGVEEVLLPPPPPPHATRWNVAKSTINTTVSRLMLSLPIVQSSIPNRNRAGTRFFKLMVRYANSRRFY
jgi:hypothetical protein